MKLRPLINFISRRHMSKGRLLDELYSEIRAQKFEDIAVIQTKFNAELEYLILASAFNDKHLSRGTELLNKHYKFMKEESQEFARVCLSDGWNVLDFRSIVVHLFNPETRKHFDIEQLWAVGEKYDSKSQPIPVVNSSALKS